LAAKIDLAKTYDRLQWRSGYANLSENTKFLAGKMKFIFPWGMEASFYGET
jgi:hypothetical protein